jgi:glutathione peroxidase
LETTTQSESKKDVAWNFEKFLVDKHGKVIARYLSKVRPLSKAVTDEIEKALK